MLPEIYCQANAEQIWSTAGVYAVLLGGLMKKTAWLLCVLLFAVGIAVAADDTIVKKALKWHFETFTVDTHCDTPMRLVDGKFDIGQRHEPGKRESGSQDLPRMKEGGLVSSFFAVFVGQGERTNAGHAEAKADAIKTLDALGAMFAKYPDLAERALTPQDAKRIWKSGKRAIFIGLENGYPIGKDLDLIDYYYSRGVRYITLVHTEDNDIAASSTDRTRKEEAGLTDFGREVVKRMNQIGMIIDVSHSSDKAFFDVLEASKAPVLASHSSSRAVCDSPRNLTDDMLRALKKNGGVIQICILDEYVKTPTPNPERDKAYSEFRKKIREKYGSWRNITDPADRAEVEKEYASMAERYPREKVFIKDAVDHIDHVVKLIGIDHVGIGTDFDGGGGLTDCRDVTQFPSITVELVRRGYSKDDIEKIWGRNTMRVMRQVIAQAKKLRK